MSGPFGRMRELEGTTIDETVVQAVGSADPELDFVGDDSEAAPMGGERDMGVQVGLDGGLPVDGAGLEMELMFVLGDQVEEVVAGGEGLGLGAGPGADTRADGPASEVGLGFLGGGVFGGAADADLLVERAPIEGQ